MDHLQIRVAQLMEGIGSVGEALESQADFAHQYWSAAAEDIAESSRDWAAIHAAIRSRAGMKAMGIPLTTKFVD